MKSKNKVILGLTGLVVFIIIVWMAWNFMIPSQDIKKSIKDMQADSAGLNRLITHTLYDGSKKVWECKTKIYAFPTENGSGAGFSFIDTNGKKIICGPGWRIEEQ